MPASTQPESVSTSPESMDAQSNQSSSITVRYRRILLKVSGEMIGSEHTNFQWDVIHQLAKDVAQLSAIGVKVGLVVGGGNIFRARQMPKEMDRVSADHMGMLATAINAIAITDALKHEGVHVRTMTALPIHAIAEPYVKGRMDSHFKKNRVVVFASGTGNPYFTTDTAAALRAAEMKADLLIKATRVDGVYDADPILHPNATRYERLSYSETLQKGLEVMDGTALTLCRENQIPIMVLNGDNGGVLVRAARGEMVGTVIEGK